MRYRPLFVLAFGAAIGTSLLLQKPSLAGTPANKTQKTQPVAKAPEPIGRITASFGDTVIDNPHDGKRGGDLHSLVYNDERIVTDGGGMTLLLASRVVLKVDANTALSVSESTAQTSITLEHGTAHVFVGKRPAASGVVVLQDAQVRAETEQGVFLASFDPATGD